MTKNERMSTIIHHQLATHQPLSTITVINHNQPLVNRCHQLTQPALRGGVAGAFQGIIKNGSKDMKPRFNIVQTEQAQRIPVQIPHGT